MNKSIEVFKEYYQNEKVIIDNKVHQFNQQLLEEKNSILKENLCFFQKLNESGKRIRGVLVNLGYYLLKEDKSYSSDLALAYEVFQTSILIHDDVIDKDMTRRGVDTIHSANIKKYQKDDIKDEVNHLGNSIAICMGDYGLYLANKIIFDSYKDNSNISKVFTYFNNTVLNTIKGELLDVVLPFESKKGKISNELLEENIMNIYRLKTSYYTIIGPLATGLLLAKADDKKIQDIQNFGEKVGIAFQIQDDILGIYSDEMGKVKGSDIKEFKQTLLFSHICTTEYKEELLKYYGNSSLTEKSIEKVKELFEKSESKKYAEKLMNQLYDESLTILENIDWLPTEKKELLRGFVEYLRIRKK